MTNSISFIALGATSGETVEFEYDSDGMLIGEKSAGMERKFTQQNRFATRELVKNRNGEWEMSAYHTIHGQMLATHISSNSKKAGMNKVSNETGTIFYHTDHLGSVRLTTDQNGNIVSSSSTDAYGNPLPGATTQPNTPPGSPKNKGAKMLSTFNFIGTHGIRYVEKVKLHNMRARWYGNSQRRFESMDPFLVNALNRYLYSNLNPQSYIDPTGLVDISVITNIIKGWKLETPWVDEDAKSEKTYLCKIVSKIYDICKNILYFNKATHIQIGQPFGGGVSGAAWVHDDNRIYINESYWEREKENLMMPYILMEELIHMRQDSDFTKMTCPNGYDCRHWLFKIMMFEVKWEKVPQPPNRLWTKKINGVDCLPWGNILAEVWAQRTKIFAMDNAQGNYFSQPLRDDFLNYLNLYSYFDRFYPYSGNANPRFINFYQTLQRNINGKNIPEVLRSWIFNTDAKGTYSRYCG